MFTHISMFQLKAEDKGAAAELVEFLRALPAQVPGVVRNDAYAAAAMPGPPVPPPPGAGPKDGGPAFFDVIQRISFATASDCAAYPASPGHSALIARFDEKIAAVAAIDYEEPEA